MNWFFECEDCGFTGLGYPSEAKARDGAARHASIHGKWRIGSYDMEPVVMAPGRTRVSQNESDQRQKGTPS